MNGDDEVVQVWCPRHGGWFEDIKVAVAEHGGWCPRCGASVGASS